MDCHGGFPKPHGWRTGPDSCPNGHPAEFHRLVGQARRYWYCLACQHDNRAVLKNAKSMGESATLASIGLLCGHNCHYRKGSFTRAEPLYCFRCDDWVPQGAAA